MKILWMSNAPWCQTGYGVQANSLLPRLMKLDSVKDIAVFAYYGLQGAIMRMPVGEDAPVKTVDLLCYPPRTDMYGNDIANDHARHFGADVIISLLDVWVHADDFGAQGTRWIPYMPVDMEPVPKAVADKARKSFRPLVYTRNAQQALFSVDIEADYIPLGVETKVYKPFKYEKQRQDAKEMLGMPRDSYLVGCVGANKGYPPRKGWPELFEAFSMFRRNHSDALLYCHTLHTGEYQGMDLQAMADDYGILKYTYFTDPYKHFTGISSEIMNGIYNAMDVFCLPSMGEGFGVPIVEAQSAGCPVIITEWSAMRELLGAGWFIQPSSRVYSPLRSWQVQASPYAAADALEESYKSNRKELGVQAREFAMDYDWDNIVSNFWQPYLANLNAEISPRVYRPT